MDYGKLGKPDMGNSTRSEPDPEEPTSMNPSPKSRNLKLLFIFSATFLVASAVSVAVLFGIRPGGSSGGSNHSGLKPTLAISRTCSKTRYPDLCIDSLLQFPGASAAGEPDLVHISVNMTLQRVGKALYDSTGFSNLNMEPQLRSAYDDCLELLDDSFDQLSKSLVNVAVGSSPSTATSDVMTWLSAALTNQDTCTEGLGGVGGADKVKTQMEVKLKDLSELVSNCLAIYSSAAVGSDFSGIPIQDRRRLLGFGGVDSGPNRFPKWMSRRDRLLAETPAGEIQADIVVAKDGTGTCTTIKEAIKKAPEKSNRRFIIYVKAGKYEEDVLKVGRKKTNLMFIGDGKGKTVITGKKSVADKLTTFHTASFAAQGAGFIARDITFENYAGPEKHQAVALRVGADHAVIYRCSVIGYQDTLYVHSNRQFYRDCDIYGTVDFIFGNAAVVLQNCNIYARKPMDNQKNTITAQNRKDPNQNTGISIHACKIVATPDLEASKGSFPTYLGRPWKMYSRVVILMSSMGDHIHPQGWLEWNANFALDTLYYGEYMNYGPGAAVGQRVKWPGYHVIKSSEEASRFTVSKFIYGSSWLPSTGVAFLAGLSV